MFYRPFILLICMAPTLATAQQRARPAPQTELDFITQVFNTLQPRSIIEKREYCGYLDLNAQGEYTITPPISGDFASCTLDEPPDDLQLLASYHTHGSYDVQYDSEIPSYDDLNGDIYEQLNGYIATPGGRIWFNDANAERTIMLCDINCIIADPRFRPDPYGPNKQSYSIDELWDRQGY